MDYPDAELPPAKKRRFFSEPSPASEQPFQFEPSLLDDSNVPDPSPSLRTTPVPEDVQRQEVVSADAVPQNVDNSDLGQGGSQGFDIGLFKSVVGVELAPETSKRIREAAGENTERGMTFERNKANSPIAPLS